MRSVPARRDAMIAFLGEKKLFTAIFAALAAFHVALVLSTRLFPFTDLPDHLAAATVARHIGEPGNRFAELYRVETGLRPNTAHLAVSASRIFPSVEAANRALLALYVVLLPVSLLLILRKLGGSPWYALLSFTLLYNYNASWGFMGFALAAPLVLLFYRFFAIDAAALDSPQRAALAALWLVALYFVHVLAALFALLALLAGAPLASGKRWRALARRLVVAGPLLVLTALWWRMEGRGSADPGLGEFLASYYGGEFLPGFAGRRLVFVFDNYHLFDGRAGHAVALAFSLAIALAAAAPYLAARGKGPGPAPAVRAAAPLLIAAALCCLVLPNGLPRQSVLYERFSVFLLIGLVVAGGALAGPRLRRPAIAAFVALAVAHGALWAEYFASFNRENRGFDAEFLRGASREQTLAGMVRDYRFRGRPAYIHFPSYYVVWERGAATAKFTDYRFGAVRRRAGAPELPTYLEWIGKTGAYDGRYAGMDLLLARGVPPGDPALAGFAPLRHAGKWSLLERRPSAAPAPARGAPQTP